MKHRLTTLASALLLAAGTAYAGPYGSNQAEATESKGMPSQEEVVRSFEEGVLQGKVSTAILFSEPLSIWDINTEVRGSTAVLSGLVSSEIERDLAEELALGVDGIDQVKNMIQIDSSANREADANEYTLGERMSDASTTASVKVQLMTNSEISGLAIDVDTKEDVVTLSGEVDSQAERELAGEIARNTSGVARVENQLMVSAGADQASVR